MVSCSEHPTQAECVWWNARKLQNGLPGRALETRESSSTSAIMRSMTRPRYASMARLRWVFSIWCVARGSYIVHRLEAWWLYGSTLVKTGRQARSEEHTSEL